MLSKTDVTRLEKVLKQKYKHNVYGLELFIVLLESKILDKIVQPSQLLTVHV